MEDIWLYVAVDNLQAADNLIDRIIARCLDLVDQPRLGPARPEIAPDARMLVVRDYLVLYRIQDADVQIVRVVHGARRLEGLFDVEPDS